LKRVGVLPLTRKASVPAFKDGKEGGAKWGGGLSSTGHNVLPLRIEVVNIKSAWGGVDFDLPAWI